LIRKAWVFLKLDGERTIKRLLEGKPGGERERERKERPSLRWMDDVGMDLRNMGVKEEEEELS
jgi:hypothetical protein